jgi:GNAT superfamily N-acetyltransferase
MRNQEDLFVTQAARGKGVGRRLMIRLAAIAVERGWERIDFQVLDWNPARRLLSPAERWKSSSADKPTLGYAGGCASKT